MKIRIGSRESRLAVMQSQMVMAAIQREHPEIEMELVTMKTTGDKILDKTLDKIGGKGLFVKELDRALLAHEVDITVHSFKDMPMEVDDRLPIVAVSKREDPRDALVLPHGAEQPDFSRPIGCSSARRRIQLRQLLPECDVKPVRGNVLTRLEKLDSGEYGALVLAAAGLRRLGLTDRISRLWDTAEMIPAACQGILAVQAHKDLDPWFLKAFHDEDAAVASRAERAFVRALDGGCSAPIAAYAALVMKGREQRLHLTGLYAQEDKPDCIHIRSAEGKPIEAEQLGQQLAQDVRSSIGKGNGL